MRAALVLVLVIITSLAGLAVPLVGLYGYVIFGLMRPDQLAWLGPNRYSFILAVSTLLSSFRHLQDVNRVLADPITRGFLLLQIPIGLSVVFAIDSELSLVKYIPFLQMCLMTLLIPILIETKDHLRYMILCMGFGLGFLGLKFGLYGIMAGGAHFVQGIEGFHAENNTLSLGLATALPLCWQGVFLCRKTWSKAIFASLVFGSIAAIFMTQSRTGILSLAVALLLTVWDSKYRMRTMVVLGILALPAPLLVWDALTSRMSTLSDPLEEASAASRYDLNQATYRLIRDYPVFGVGFGADNAAQASRKYKTLNVERTQVAHNNYLQWAADSGLPAFFLYCLLQFGSIVWLHRCASRYKKTDPEFYHIASALKIALCAFSVGSAFTSRTNYDFIYMLLLTSGCLYRITKEHEQAALYAQPVPAATQPAVPAVSVPAPIAPRPVVAPAPSLTARPTGLGRALRSAGRDLPR